ncbi:MAG: helix-turn-helix domain-containing protein [Patescibacteria group bacterium]|nr:helix-turn-helix domain-containing protein [Patescibacteria group bacterium]MCL5224267.1 helix-turn-helix domain-containing protein [Patescibacteria group bacterium]
MDAKDRLKLRAIRLRKDGLSYNEIRKVTPIAKSTLSLWLKSVPLSSSQRKRLYTKQITILSRGSQSQKERRKREVREIIEAAEDEIILPLDTQAHLLFGAALYWAEGSKKNLFEITNSDPALIAFMVRWIEKVFLVSPKELRAWLNLYPQQDEVSIKRFWSGLTGIPFSNFGKSYTKPPGKNYKKNNLYYGTIKVMIPRSTDLKHRMFGWIKAVLKEDGPRVEAVLKRWERLKSVARPVNLM